MERTMLIDEGSAIDTYNFVAGECESKLLSCKVVGVGVVVGGVKDGVVQNEVVGIGGWEAQAFVIVCRFCHGEWYKAVGFATEGGECFEFLFHGVESCIVFVGGVVALDVSYRILWTEACKGVDV